MEDILFRNLREEENIEDGLWASDQSADYNTCYHVGHGTKGKSQWVSTSVSISVLVKYMSLKQDFSRIAVIDEDKLDMPAEDCRGRKDWLKHDILKNRMSLLPAYNYGNASQEKCVLYYIPARAVECVLASREEMMKMQESLTNNDRKAIKEAAEMLCGKHQFKASPELMAVIADRRQTEYRKNSAGVFNFGRKTFNRFSNFEFTVDCNYTASEDDKKAAETRLMGFERKDGKFSYGSIGMMCELLDKGVIEYIRQGDLESARNLLFAASKSINIMIEVARKDLNINKTKVDTFKIPQVEPEKIKYIETEKDNSDEKLRVANAYFAQLSRGAKTAHRDEIFVADGKDGEDGYVAVWGEAKVTRLLQKEFGGDIRDGGYVWIGTAEPEKVKQLIDDAKQIEEWLCDAAKRSVFNKSKESIEEYQAAKELHDDFFKIEKRVANKVVGIDK